MSEDGRSTGMAAPRGLSPGLFEVWGDRDAQPDAVTNSVGLAGRANAGAYRVRNERSQFKIRILRGVSL